MTKFRPTKLPFLFWNEERGLTSIFILLCATNFIIVPFLSGRVIITLLMKITWLAMLMAGVTSLSSDRRQMRLLLLLPVLFVIVGSIDRLTDNKSIEYLDFFLDLSAFGLLIGMILIKVFGPGNITFHRVLGAIVVYMLLGNLWAIAYHFVYMQVPGSITFSNEPSGHAVNMDLFTYFSYTTLTTTGYGDILPVHKITRILSVAEQLIGVLFPAVLIGRLVSEVVGNKKRE